MSNTPMSELMARMMTDTRGPSLVAYRGLWDKFASPGTPGAVRRAYRRGVPSLIRPGADLTLADAMAMVSDPAINHFHQPIYFVMPYLAPVRVMEGRSPSVFVVVCGGPADRPWPMWRWYGNAWVPVGCYVPVGAALNLSSFRSDSPAHVLFESSDVLADLAERDSTTTSDDDAMLAAIRLAWGTSSGRASLGHLGIAKVTDMVEVEQLDQRVREAA